MDTASFESLMEHINGIMCTIIYFTKFRAKILLPGMTGYLVV